jgi:hypothetical protein
MTLQVGLVGNDGIVLASDRLINDIEDSSRFPRFGCKFRCVNGVVCCHSGDFVAELGAREVSRSSWDGKPVVQTLEDIGNGVFQYVETEYGPMSSGSAIRKVLCAIPESGLWLLNIARISVVNPVRDRVITGDVKNTARYFFYKYAADCTTRPVAQLIPLAAYVILAASEENRDGVGGLEVAIIPTGKDPIFLSGEQERALERDSSAIRKYLGKRLLRPFAI